MTVTLTFRTATATAAGTVTYDGQPRCRYAPRCPNPAAEAIAIPALLEGHIPACQRCADFYYS